MKIVEDKVDRDRLFHSMAVERFPVRAKIYDPTPSSGWVRKHALWPCVRLGAAATWLRDRGWVENPGSRRRALNFLRGHSHEAMLAHGQSVVMVYEGVANELDEWTGVPEAPFTEIKSTVVSSARMWPLVKQGGFDLLSPADVYFRAWFEQCCQNCVASGTDRCRLRVFFMQGEYGSRRKNCPECGKPLGELVDIYRPCTKCGYKTYNIDLRSYILTFAQAELSYYRKEVFHKRRDQYQKAIKAETAEELRSLAPATSCFICGECEAGKAVGCEQYRGPK